MMNKKLFFLKPENKVKEAIKIMKGKGISQIPIMKNSNVCGIINEKIILEAMTDNKNVQEIKIEKIMDDSPPIVSLKTTKKVILEILKEQAIVLVAEKGEIKGLISKSDLLGKI